MGRALRIFYRKSDGQIVWYHETRSPEGLDAICPTTVAQDLAEIPDKMPDGKTALGGVSSDYNGIEVKEKDIEAYFASDDNKVVGKVLIIGKPREV